ncbi:hypothetical protein FHT21_001673 [Pedobacter sp. SG908]|nr:hypothetical protein [Pedobacter sp. SG908]NMN36648.1 hypothetical protein [Pedobacter sp. SG918]
MNPRKRLAIDDVKSKGHEAIFEGYGKAADYK